MTTLTKYRLVVADVDYTLKPGSDPIPAANIEVLQQAMDQGVAVAIASGRPTHSIRSSLLKSGLCERLFDRLLVVGFNGAETSTHGRTQHSEFVPIRAVEQVVEFCRRDERTNAALFAGEHFSMIRRDRWWQYYEAKLDYRPVEGWSPDMPADAVHKIVVMSEPGNAELTGEVDQLLTGLSGASWWRAKTQWAKKDRPAEWAEVMAEGVNKGNATRRLAAELGLDLADVICIGDGINDLEMLEIPEVCSIVMGNTEYEELLRMPKLHVTAPAVGADPPGAAQSLRWLLGLV